jgi:Retroviral aspartyl protease
VPSLVKPVTSSIGKYIIPNRRIVTLVPIREAEKHPDEDFQQFLEVKATIKTVDSLDKIAVEALVDPGCTHSSIDAKFVEQNKLTTKKLLYPRDTINADGTTNKHGQVQETTDITLVINGHRERITLAVTKLHSHHIFLGFDWMYEHNPSINWQHRMVKFDRCQHFSILQQNISTEIAIAQEEKKEKKTWQETVPKEFHGFKKVFTKESFDTLPEHRPWDHKIDLKDDTKVFKGKVYPLSFSE